MNTKRIDDRRDDAIMLLMGGKFPSVDIAHWFGMTPRQVRAARDRAERRMATPSVVRRERYLSEPCPTCGSPAGKGCRTVESPSPGRWQGKTHVARRRAVAAREAAA